MSEATPVRTDRPSRKQRTGLVVSDVQDKTVVVRIDRKTTHGLYSKTLSRSGRVQVHDENNEAHTGDTVRIMETRPLSKTKRWRLVEVIERAK